MISIKKKKMLILKTQNAVFTAISRSIYDVWYVPTGGFNKCNKKQFRYQYMVKVWLAIFFLHHVVRWGLHGSDVFAQHIPQMPDWIEILEICRPDHLVLLKLLLLHVSCVAECIVLLKQAPGIWGYHFNERVVLKTSSCITHCFAFLPSHGWPGACACVLCSVLLKWEGTVSWR